MKTSNEVKAVKHKSLINPAHEITVFHQHTKRPRKLTSLILSGIAAYFSVTMQARFKRWGARNAAKSTSRYSVVHTDHQD